MTELHQSGDKVIGDILQAIALTEALLLLEDDILIDKVEPLLEERDTFIDQPALLALASHGDKTNSYKDLRQSLQTLDHLNQLLNERLLACKKNLQDRLSHTHRQESVINIYSQNT